MRKFVAPTMKDALEQMRREMGDEAIILSTKTIPLGGNGSEIVEVIAISDEESESASEIADIESADNPAGSAAFIGMRNDLADMRRALDETLDSIRYRYAASLGERHGNLYKYLRQNDIPEEDALRLVGRASAAVGGFAPEKELIEAARAAVATEITIHPPLQPASRAVTAAFVGATGSGKTSTIAKLAAVCKLVFKTETLIISADTYKVGGAEQLQTFAAIAGIPFRSAYSAQELRQIMRQTRPNGLILIDTVGRSQRNSANLNEISAMLDAAEPDVIYLTQSAVVAEQTLTDVLQRFKKALAPSAMILTKTDEAASIGQVYAAIRRSPLPLAYISTGQNIPDDLEPATADGFARILLP